MRLKVLDSLRGIAAIFVSLFYHYKHLDSSTSPIFSTELALIYEYGWCLVDFFFVLSGFVMAFVYLEKIKKGELSFKKFIVNRISRIYPIHIITLLFIISLIGIRLKLGLYGNDFVNTDIYHFILNLTMLHKSGLEFGFSYNGPSWSVGIEAMMYIIFFLILTKYKSYILEAVLVVVIIGLTLYRANFNVAFLNSDTGRYASTFFMGNLTYLLYKKIIEGEHQTRISIILLCFLIFFGYQTYEYGLSAIGYNWILVFGILLFPMVILIFLLNNKLNIFFSNKVFVYFGTISFSLYLWHYPLIMIFRTIQHFYAINFNSFSTWVTFSSLLILISHLSYFYIEVPSLKKIRLWYS